MYDTDPSARDEYDDHCLIHHFIRATGRRPTDGELVSLRQQPHVPRPRDPVAPGALSQTVRREVARLIHRI